MRNKIKKETFDKERSLYNISNTDIISCTFAGENDGESPLKESKDITIIDCDFSLRYPLWHNEKFSISKSRFDELSRAPIWYAKNGIIDNCNINSIKCLRNCENISVSNSEIYSEETGWMSKNLNIKNSKVSGDYLFLRSENVKIDDSILSGKYGLQYMKNVKIKNSKLDTKDAFWHSENVVIEDSVIKGAYLGWYSKNLTIKNCRITGTQPLCYCENLKLINCKMPDCDLAFEYSSVEAKIIGKVHSIKNPKSGHIICDSVDEIILIDSKMKSTAVIEELENN